MGILEEFFKKRTKTETKIEKNPCAEYRKKMAETIPEEIPEDLIDKACGCTPRENIVNHLDKPTISIKGDGR